MKWHKAVAVSLIAAFVFASTNAQAHGFSTRAIQAISRSLTAAGYMGAARYATAALPTCSTANLSALAWDTTTSSLKVCNGSAFAALGGGGATTIAFNDDVAATWGTGTDFSIDYDTAQTPDSTIFGVSSDSRAIIIAEKADADFDWAHAQQANPTLFIQSADGTVTTKWLSLTHDGTNGIIDVGTGAVAISDAEFILFDDGDPTKIAAFQASGITAGQTRTFTLPDASTTLGGLGVTQTWSSNNSFTSNVLLSTTGSINLGSTGSPGDNRILRSTASTPDTGFLGTGTTGMSWVVAESQDSGTDWAHALPTHPSIFVHSINQGTVTQYLGISAHGLQTELFKTLSEGAATSIVRIPVAAEAGVGGMLIYTVYATDGSTPQTRHGRIIWTVVNDGGTETCVLGTAEELDNTPTGTLTATVTCDTTPTNAVDLQLNATSSLTQTTLQAYYTVIVTGPGAPLLQ